MLRIKVIPEAIEQQSFFTWLEIQHPELAKLTFAIPNGRTSAKEGSKYKKMGARAGVPDVFLATPAGVYHGLFIEFKRKDGGGGLSPAQKVWFQRLRDAGYACVLACGWEEGKRAVEQYYLPGGNLQIGKAQI